MLQVLQVEILEAKPNTLFSEDQRRLIRFLRYNKPVECPECGRKRRIFWTMLVEFRAGSMDENAFSLREGCVRPPLEPVCSEHTLQPIGD